MQGKQTTTQVDVGIRTGITRQGENQMSEKDQEVTEGYAAKVDLNTATEEQLCELPGIGPALAARIVDYRQEEGPFQEKTGVTAVSGITDAVYQRRGWTPDGVPTLEKLGELGIDFPEVVEAVKPYLP